MVIAAAMMMRVPLMRTAGGVTAAGVIGGALVYVVMRWGLLPSADPLMAFVPQTAFFLAHLLFGLVAGVVLAVMFRRCGMIGGAQAGRGRHCYPADSYAAAVVRCAFTRQDPDRVKT